jgi:Predicted membrane protein
MVSFYAILWIFILYAFIGWCSEVVFAAVVLGKFVNRGFLNGPFCPIYGFGMLAVILCLSPIKENTVILFLGSLVLTSGLEFLAGFVLERAFHTKWWDYSDKPFNLFGYICLAFSLLWGLGCVFVMKIIHPAILELIRITPVSLGYSLLTVVYIVFLTDTILTIISVLGLNKQFIRLEKLSASIKKISDELGGNISESTFAAMDANDKLKDILEEKKLAFEEAIQKIPKYRIISYKRLINAFPKLKNHKVYLAIEKFVTKKKG